MTGTKGKLRSLFLATLMVLSVFAGTVALSGTAAAANLDESNYSFDDYADSGDTFWQGQEVLFNAEYLVENASNVGSPSAASNDQRTFQIREYDADNSKAGSLVQEFTVDDEGGAVLNTSSLEGEFVIKYPTNDDIVHVVSNGTFSGVATTSGDNVLGTSGSLNADDSNWEVAVQTLSSSFDESEAVIGDEVDLNVDSNRGSGYTVNISADSLDYDDLNATFNVSANTVVTSQEAEDDDKVQVQVPNDGDITADFGKNSDFEETGDFTFEVSVNDTTAESTSSITLLPEDREIDIEDSMVVEQTGDVASVTLSLEDTNQGWLYIGDDDTNFLEAVKVEDENDDNEVTLHMNTYLMGRSTTGSWDNNLDNEFVDQNGAGFDNAKDAYMVGEEDGDSVEQVVRYDTEDGANEIDQGASVDDETDSEAEFSVSTNYTDPVEAGNYNLRAATSAGVSAEGDVSSETDVGTLSLEARSTDNVKIWTAAKDDVDYDDVADLTDAATQSSTIAIDDHLIVEVEASGIYGYVEDEDDATAVLRNHEGLNLTLEQTNDVTNQDPRVLFGYDDDDNIYNEFQDSQLLVDSENNTFYYAVSTADSDIQNESLTDGDQFSATFKVGNEDASSSPNPYVEDETEESVSTSLSFEDPDAEFDSLNADDELELGQADNITVSGTTNVAPGNDVTVRLRSTGANAFLRAPQAAVNDDGTFTANVDLADIPVGTEYTATIKLGTTTISDEIDGQIVGVEDTPTATPMDNETTTTMGDGMETTVTTTATPEPVETTTTEEPDDTTTTMSDGSTGTDDGSDTTTTSTSGPGFTAVLSAVALLGAAFLALRRRD